MKKFGEYDLSKLSDSRMLYLRNPPKFAYIFTAIVAIVLAGILIWSSFAVKAEQAESTGIIVSEDKLVMMPEITGTISEILIKEGSAAGKGDIILTFDKTAVNLEISRLGNEITRLGDRIGYIDKFVDVTYEGNPRQPFADTGDQREFYSMFGTYRSNFDACFGDGNLIISLNNQTRSSLLSERSAVSSSLMAAESNLETYENSLSKHDIKAISSGIVHYDIAVTRGMMLQSGTQIGSISVEGGAKIIEMYIPSYERSKMEAGQECKFTVDGLAQTEYGSLSGEVISISSDAIIQNNGAFFKAIIGFDAEYIEDSKGDRIDLVNGMTVRVWVTYEKITYLKYWFEQLGLGEYL